MDKRNLIKNGAVVKLAAAVAALTLIAAASLLPAKAEPAQLTDPDVLNPAPVVMTIEEADEAVIEEESSADEEKKQKMGIFTRMKLAFCPCREMFQFIDPVRVARCSSSLTSSGSRHGLAS